MGRYAIIKNDVVDSFAISDSPLETDGLWICVDDINPQPMRGWTYKDGAFSESPTLIYVSIYKIKSVLVDVWADIEASTDTDVQAWVVKVNAAEQLVYDPQYDADLKMLVDKGMITPAHVDRLVPYSPMFGG